MRHLLDDPFAVFALLLVIQWCAAYFGNFVGKIGRRMSDTDHQDFESVQTATLTLLVLLIGFTFSMAVTRYDQRKTLEEAEANTIGTEFLRIDLLAPEEAAHLHELIARYLDLRISFYSSHNEWEISTIDADTGKLQADLWAAVSRAAKAQPNPVTAFVATGMNDVLNSQGYTRAAWSNRIPLSAWVLLALTALACNVLLGYGERRRGSLLLLVFPFVVSVSFLLIADIDSPRRGIIRVQPQNLLAAAQSISRH
jgi:hypothetical protein